jgi:hypothetical protein
MDNASNRSSVSDIVTNSRQFMRHTRTMQPMEGQFLSLQPIAGSLWILHGQCNQYCRRSGYEIETNSGSLWCLNGQCH